MLIGVHSWTRTAAGGPDGCVAEESAVERWAAATTFVTDEGTSAAMTRRNTVGLQTRDWELDLPRRLDDLGGP